MKKLGLLLVLSLMCLVLTISSFAAVDSYSQNFESYEAGTEIKDDLLPDWSLIRATSTGSFIRKRAATNILRLMHITMQNTRKSLPNRMYTKLMYTILMLSSTFQRSLYALAVKDLMSCLERAQDMNGMAMATQDFHPLEAVDFLYCPTMETS